MVLRPLMYLWTTFSVLLWGRSLSIVPRTWATRRIDAPGYWLAVAFACATTAVAAGSVMVVWRALR